jgi:hypothetical protein
VTARRVLYLAVAALLVLGIAAYLSMERDSRGAGVSRNAVLPGLSASVNAVTEIRLSKGDGTLVTLRKRASDWMVAERDYRADSGRIRKLLLDLGAMKVVEEKTRTPENYPQLGVEDLGSDKAGGTLVEVIEPKQSFTLIVGKPAGTKGSYVRVPKTEQSLLVQPQINLDADAKRWIDRTLLDVPRDRIREVSVHPADGPQYTVTRATKDQTDFSVSGVPKGRSLSSSGAANSAASALASLTLDDVRQVPKEAVDPRKLISATFTTFDGLTLEISGRKEGERHYLRASALSTAKETAAEADSLNASLGGWEFEIPAYKYDAIFRPLEELLAKS